MDAISVDTSLYITVIANHYTGCNAGRREASVFQDVAIRIHDGRDTPNVNFMVGGDCGRWTVNDESYVLRDEFFTAPFPHPAYVILDWEGRVREKVVGPCCGYESYSDCPTATAEALNATLTDAVIPESF